VKLTDTRTGSVVTIQNSEVKKISKKEYKEGLAAPVSKAAPAAAPAAPAAAPAAKPAEAPAEKPAAAPEEPAAPPTEEKK
jgi:cytochrome c oxidase subunit 2